jgi:4'-phosphopantetheinyl transferase
MGIETWIQAVAPGTVPPSGTVDVWLTNLDDAPSAIAGALNEEERMRADRFHYPRDRIRAIAARGYLRHLLGAYLGTKPEAVQIEYGAWGKPGTAPGAGQPLAFNLAHSAGFGLYAMAQTSAVGIDLEGVRPMENLREDALHIFAEAECRELFALPESQQRDAFFACWTRKEAIVKLWGEGLTAKLNSFTVSANPSAPARVISVSRPGMAAGDIALRSFRPLCGFWASIAAPAAALVNVRFLRHP